MSTVYRIVIANVAPNELLATLKAAGFSGTLQAGAIGFTSQWGDEYGSVIEVATERADELMHVVAAQLTAAHESAAYFTADGCCAQLLYADGHIEQLHDARILEVA